MGSRAARDRKEMPAWMDRQEDRDFPAYRAPKETQVFPDCLAKMDSQERTACLEKMVSPVHLAHLDQREITATRVWTGSQGCQVQRETLAMASQVFRDPRVIRVATDFRVSKAAPECRAKTDFRVSTEKREIPVCRDCRDKRENPVCRDSQEPRVIREGMD